MGIGGGFQSLVPGLGTLLLKLLQFRFRLGESAVQALLVQTEAGEEVATAVEGFGLGEGAVDGGVIRGQAAREFLEAEREEIIFRGADAVEAPVGVGDGLDSLGFEQTLRLELGVELGAMLLIGCEIVFGQNDGLAGEAVAESVEGRSALAFGGDWTSGAGGVFAVDGSPPFFERRRIGANCDFMPSLFFWAVACIAPSSQSMAPLMAPRISGPDLADCNCAKE